MSLGGCFNLVSDKSGQIARVTDATSQSHRQTRLMPAKGQVVSSPRGSSTGTASRNRSLNKNIVSNSGFSRSAPDRADNGLPQAAQVGAHACVAVGLAAIATGRARSTRVSTRDVHPTRPLLSQHDRAALVQSYDVERVLADIDADYGDRSVKLLRHGVLLVVGAPFQLRSAGQDHGRTIPLANLSAAGWLIRRKRV